MNYKGLALCRFCTILYKKKHVILNRFGFSGSFNTS
jgi:hypothetical protein